MKLNQKIKQARKMKGLTLKDVGAYLGYSEAHMSYVENGKRFLKLIDYDRLEMLLGIEIDGIKGPPQFEIKRGKETEENIFKEISKINIRLDEFWGELKEIKDELKKTN